MIAHTYTYIQRPTKPLCPPIRRSLSNRYRVRPTSRYQLRPLAIFFLTGLSGVVVLHTTGPLPASPMADILPEMASALIDALFAVHTDKRCTFCLTAVGVLSAVAYVGCMVSGISMAIGTMVTLLGAFVVVYAMAPDHEEISNAKYREWIQCEGLSV